VEYVSDQTGSATSLDIPSPNPQSAEDGPGVVVWWEGGNLDKAAAMCAISSLRRPSWVQPALCPRAGSSAARPRCTVCTGIV
jgi:hypothetical protein